MPTPSKLRVSLLGVPLVSYESDESDEEMEGQCPPPAARAPAFPSPVSPPASLLAACERGDCGKAQEALWGMWEAGLSADTPLRNGWTALAVAVARGHVALVRELLAGGCDAARPVNDLSLFDIAANMFAHTGRPCFVDVASVVRGAHDEHVDPRAAAYHPTNQAMARVHHAAQASVGQCKVPNCSRPALPPYRFCAGRCSCATVEAARQRASLPVPGGRVAMDTSAARHHAQPDGAVVVTMVCPEPPRRPQPAVPSPLFALALPPHAAGFHSCWAPLVLPDCFNPELMEDDDEDEDEDDNEQEGFQEQDQDQDDDDDDVLGLALPPSPFSHGLFSPTPLAAAPAHPASPPSNERAEWCLEHHMLEMAA